MAHQTSIENGNRIVQHPRVLNRLIPGWMADLAMFELPSDVVVQFSETTAITFLKSRILTIARIRTSCRALETLFAAPVQKLIADVCVQCHGTVPYISKCSHSIICRVGASAKTAVFRLLDALERADVRNSAFRHIPKERTGAVDDEILTRCGQLLLHSDSETKRCASLLIQCWKGGAHCRKLGVVVSTRGSSSSVTYELINVQESDPELKAITSLENALNSDSILDHTALSSVLELVRQDTATLPEELAGILAGLGLGPFPKSLLISNAGSETVNGTYNINAVSQRAPWPSQSRNDFRGRYWYKQQNGPHRLFFFNAFGDDPDGWYIDSEEKPQYAFYVSECGQDEVPLRGWTVYAGSFAAQGTSPAPSLTRKEPIYDDEFQRSAWRLCKLARNSVRKRSDVAPLSHSRSRSRSRSRPRSQQDDRTKGKSASKGFGGFRGGYVGKGYKGGRRQTGRR